MDLKLSRVEFRPDGIFGLLYNSMGVKIASTLEHSCLSGVTWFAKVPPGSYSCVRGTHRLHDGVPFETFEVAGVKGHTGILFHPGNWNRDSDGCILLGRDFGRIGDIKMIVDSREAFAAFMKLQAGVDRFSLSVE